MRLLIEGITVYPIISALLIIAGICLGFSCADKIVGFVCRVFPALDAWILRLAESKKD